MVRLLLFLFLVACGGAAPGGTAGVDLPYDGSSSAGTPEGVWCPNPLRPAKSKVCTGATPVCCLGGPLGVTPRCAATLQACNGDSRLECDDATDCGEGQSCCVGQVPGQGGNNKNVGRCKDTCTLFETRSCNGTGTCKGDQRCCQDEGDLYGTCVGPEAECPVDEETGF